MNAMRMREPGVDDVRGEAELGGAGGAESDATESGAAENEAAEISLRALIAPVFYPVHADIQRMGHAEYWLKGGRGSGKSSFAALELLIGLLQCPDAHAIVYRRVAATLHDSVVSQMLWAADALGRASDFRLQRSPLELIYKPTGQRILFRGADDPAKSKSLKLERGYFRFLWFEELTEFAGMDDIRSIQASVLRGGQRGITLCTYNPSRSPRHWVNIEALAPHPRRQMHHSDYRDVPPRWLGEGFLALAEALRESNERAYRHTYLGEITGDGGRVFDNLRLRALTATEIAHFDRLYFGLDHGFAVDPAVLVSVHYDPARGILCLMDEFVKVGASFDTLADAAHRMLPPGASLTADSAEPRSNDELARRGIRIVPAIKGPGSVEHGIRWLQNLREIVIDSARTPFAAREFSAYEFPADRFGGFSSAYPDRDNHTIDAVRYALESMIGRRSARVIDGRGWGL